MTPSYEPRLRNIRARLENADADGCVLYPGPNLYYVSGFFGEPNDRHAIMFVPTDGPPTFIAPQKARGQIEDTAWIEQIIEVEENSGPALASGLQEYLTDDFETVLLDDHLPYGIANPIINRLSNIQWDSVQPVMSKERLRKDDSELADLRRSAELADRVSTEIRELGDAVIGSTEAEVANEIRARLSRGGSNRVSFPIVVASGPNGDDPWYRHGRREIRPGDPVILDFGGYLDQYASDQTRTVVFAGDPPEGFGKAYAAVEQAFEAGLAAVEPGSSFAEIPERVREAFREHDVAENMRHPPGHGIGLEAHEYPGLTTETQLEMEPGMVFTLEPGIYYSGEFGIRIEDVIVVTENGPERLNDSPKTWESL